MVKQTETQGASNTYIPFYHEKCPNCGYCPFCGRKDQPFKDHWQSPYEIIWASGNTQDPQYQATIPSYTVSTATTYADVA